MDLQPDISAEEKRDFFDRQAAGWDQAEPAELEDICPLVEDLGLKPGTAVVEPGCGTGLVSALLLKQIGAGGILYAVDNSLEMLRQARAKMWPENVVFFQAYAEQLPLGAGSADVVVCFRAFPHFNDRSAALVQFSRVLRDNGLLIIAHPAGREKLNRFHAQAGGAVAEDTIPVEEEMHRMLAAHGFNVLDLVDRDDRYLLRAEKSTGITG